MDYWIKYEARRGEVEKWEGIGRRREIRGDGAKHLCLNSRKVTCEHSGEEKGPLTLPCHGDNQHLAFSAGVWSHQVIVAYFTSTWPRSSVLLTNMLKQVMRVYLLCHSPNTLAHIKTVINKDNSWPLFPRAHRWLKSINSFEKKKNKKQQFKIAFSNSSADYHNHFTVDNTL